MNSMFKGDLITIKQNGMILLWDGDERKFKTIHEPTTAIFLGDLKSYKDQQSLDIYSYLKESTPLQNPYKIAIGNKVAYIDKSHFFFYNKRRKHEKVN